MWLFADLTYAEQLLDNIKKVVKESHASVLQDKQHVDGSKKAPTNILRELQNKDQVLTSNQATNQTLSNGQKNQPNKLDC